ncbi:MAG: CRTAC1 family protein [Armatimonadota bacterium]
MKSSLTSTKGRVLAALSVPAALLWGGGCRTHGTAAPAPTPARAVEGGERVFVDEAAERGIRYSANEPTERPRDILETNGSGCAWLDYDSDGDLDALLVGRGLPALFRNDRGRFTDVTAETGLSLPGFWIGVGAADWDNDGDPDLCLSGYRCGAMLENREGRFVNVTRSSGVTFPTWGQSIAFGDVDRDGLLDLYIGAFARFDPARDQRYCRHGDVSAVCGPELYQPEIGRFYRGLGGGRFREATRASGLHTAHGRTWGAMFQDFNDDGWPDLYLANDMIAGDLFLNQGAAGGAVGFKNIGIESGTAYDANGRRQGGMGVDWGDYDNDGRSDLLVTTFSAQATALYRSDGSVFSEESYSAGVGGPTHPLVGFGARFLDFDHDGWRDLLVVNGHVEDNVEQLRSVERYRQPLLLLRNQQGKFHDVSAAALPGLREIVGRGAAFGDFDDDGRVDALVIDLEGQPLLLRNCLESTGHWLGIRLRGTRSNRDGIGARIRVTTGGRTQRLEAQPSGSLLSSNDPRVLVGLGGAPAADRVEIDWPSGKRTRLRNVAGDQYLTIQEPE